MQLPEWESTPPAKLPNTSGGLCELVEAEAKFVGFTVLEKFVPRDFGVVIAGHPS